MQRGTWEIDPGSGTMRAMLRRLAFTLAFFTALAIAVALLRAPVVRHVVRGAMDRVSARIGQPLGAGSIEPAGFGGVRLTDLRIGDATRPLLTVRELDAWAPPRELLEGRRRPRRVTLRDFELRIDGDGTPKGLVDALERLRPPAAAPPLPDSTSDDAGERPRIDLVGGRVVDTGGFVALAGLQGRVEPDGRVSLSFDVVKPSPAPCTLSGDLDGLDLRCSAPVSVTLRPGVFVDVPQVTARRRPETFVEVRGAHLRGDGLPALAQPLVDGLGFDARLGLDPDPSGARPLQAALTFAAGGRIEATGTIGRTQATLRTEVTALDLAPISTTLTGETSARVGLVVDYAARRAELEGRVELANLLVDHRAIADDKIGPYSMGVEGRIVVEQLADVPVSATPVPPSTPPAAPDAVAVPPPPSGPRLRLALSEGIVRLGEVAVRVDATVEGDTALRRARVAVDAGRLDAARLVSAFPPGLLPHLQPVRATGEAQLAFDFVLDMDAPEKTDLNIKADFSDLEVTRLNPAIDFERLRKTFETHFEMPDGEVLVNVTGPESTRWTPFDQVAPLLPIAIVTQEDGGFWNHKGISLLHLRGSLVTNVEKGRFARGGSTLTMQLARNVFLNRHKTLSRKLEEVIVAWLLERTFTKQELMELYVNVVEFGPKLFGIGDAAAYYFAKSPAELTPTEVAFIVRLLPNPRRFHEQFEKGEVKDFYAASMMRLLGLLTERGYLPRADLDAADPKALFRRSP
jgi:hypothetical protein